jgi:hypothetical protein
MEVVIQVTADAESVARQPTALTQRVRALGLTLQPIDPSGDRIMSTYYRVEVPDTATATRVIEAVREVPSVAAAYVKPGDAPP